MIRKLAIILTALTPLLTTPALSHNDSSFSCAKEILDDEDNNRMRPAHPPVHAPAPVIAPPTSMQLLCAVCGTLGAMAAYEVMKSWF